METINLVLSLLVCRISVSIFGFICGGKVVARINDKNYRKLILILTAIGSVVLFLR